MKSIVCLPGMGTNTHIMKLQMKQLESKLHDTYQFIYLEPTHEFTTIDLFDDQDVVMLLQKMSSECTEQSRRAWAELLKIHQTHEAYKLSYQRLKETILSNPNVVGVLGFSQGTFLINELCYEIQAHQEKGVDSQLVSQIQFVVYISSNLFLHHRKHGENFKLFNIRSLHILGPKDNFFSLSLMNSSRFINPKTLNHDQGHRIPILTDSQMRQLKQFMLEPAPKI